MNDQTAVNVTLYVDGCLKIFKDIELSPRIQVSYPQTALQGAKKLGLNSVLLWRYCTCGCTSPCEHSLFPFSSTKESGPRL